MGFKEQDNGYTLVELVVVISLMGLLIFITVPRLYDSLLTDDTQVVARWITANVQALKQNAVRNHKRYTLHIDLDSRKMWTTEGSMPPEDLQAASQNAFVLPNSMKIPEVMFPDGEAIITGKAAVCFYEKGYSDMAMIHIDTGDGQHQSFLVEPFLPGVKIFTKRVGFENL